MQILDEYYLIALFIVDQLIDEFFRQQNAEPARSHALLVANPRVTEQIIGRPGRGMTQFFERETLAGILDTASNRSARPNERDFHVMAGIEMAAMFHGVNQNLPESGNYMVFLSFGNARVSDSVQELDQAIRGSEITSGRQADPFGRPGKYFDAVVPAGFCHGRAHHRGQLRSLERRREIT